MASSSEAQDWTVRSVITLGRKGRAYQVPQELVRVLVQRRAGESKTKSHTAGGSTLGDSPRIKRDACLGIGVDLCIARLGETSLQH